MKTPDRWRGSWRIHGATENERIGTVQRHTRGVFEIFASRIDHSEIETWFQELQKRIALKNQRGRIFFSFGERLLEGVSHQWQAFRQKSLLCS